MRTPAKGAQLRPTDEELAAYERGYTAGAADRSELNAKRLARALSWVLRAYGEDIAERLVAEYEALERLEADKDSNGRGRD